jgi:hypothetical protein
MNITALSGLNGTLEENLTPIVSVLDNNGLQISPVGMAKIAVKEKNRIEVGMVEGPDGQKDFYIAKLMTDSKEGRSLSKTGKFQHPTIASALAGREGKWEITDEVTEDGGLSWFRLTSFVTPVKEEVTAKVVAQVAVQEEVIEVARPLEEPVNAVEPALEVVAEVEAPTAQDSINERDAIPEENADEQY